MQTVSSKETVQLSASKAKPDFRELTRRFPGGLLAIGGEFHVGGSTPLAISIATKKRMRRDPQIALGLAAIKAPIMSLSWRVECEDPVVASFVEEALSPLWRHLVRSSLNAVDFGFQAHEKVWTVQELRVRARRNGEVFEQSFPQAVLYKKLKDIDPERVRMLADETGGFRGIKLVDSEVTLPPQKCFVMSVGREWGNLYGASRLEAAYEPWHWCRVLYNYCNRYFERKGDPPIKARAPAELRVDAQGNQVNALDEAAACVQSLKAGGTAVFPDERDEQGNLRWDFQYMLDDKRADMFIDYIAHLQVMKLRALLVPERVLTQEAETGTYALAREHTETFLKTEELLLAELLDHVNRYLVPPLVFYNFGPEVPRAMVVTTGVSRANEELLREVLLQLLKAEKQADTEHLSQLIDKLKLLQELNLPTADFANQSE